MSPSVEIAVRVGCYASVFVAMALWEWSAPRRRLTVGRRPRWPGNLGILAIDIVAVRLLVPTAAVSHRSGQTYVQLAGGSERTVKLGLEGSDTVEVISGLSQGDKVVVEKTELPTRWRSEPR